MTAKLSDGCVSARVGSSGNEICVTGLLPGEGIKFCDLKDFQYVCSGVNGEGP